MDSPMAFQWNLKPQAMAPSLGCLLVAFLGGAGDDADLVGCCSLVVLLSEVSSLPSFFFFFSFSLDFRNGILKRCPAVFSLWMRNKSEGLSEGNLVGLFWCFFLFCFLVCEMEETNLIAALMWHLAWSRTLQERT